MQAGSADKKPLYYVDAMHPWYKSDKPGIAPDCGMKYLSRASAFTKLQALVDNPTMHLRDPKLRC